MSVVQPAKARHVVYEKGESLEILIPSPKEWRYILFLGVWLFFLGIIGVFLLYTSIGSIVSYALKPSGETELNLLAGIFLLICFGVLGGFYLYPLYLFLWQLIGVEAILLSSEAIGIQRAIFNKGRTKKYLAEDIKDLRVSPIPVGRSYFNYYQIVNLFPDLLVEGYLTFDYGAKTYRFGSGVDEAEARQILDKILSRFPQYGPKLRAENSE